MEKKAKVPKLRFPGFTDDWEQRKLGDMVNRVSNTSNETDLPRVEYEDILSGIGKLNKNIHEKESSKTGIEFEPGDVLFGKLRPYLKNWLLADFKGVAVGDFWVLRSNILDSNFLYCLIQTPKYNEAANLSTGTKMPRSDWNVVSKTEFLNPVDEQEQREIGVFFTNLDNLITLHQRKLTHLQAKKKSLLQKMFPKKGEHFPELRFPGFTDAWEQRKLGEISEKITTKNSSLEYTETFTNSAEYGIISQRDFFDKDISNKANLTGYYIVQDDDFVYNPRISTTAPVGPIKRNKLGRTGVMSPLYYVFKTHDIDNTFLEKYFGTTGWHEFMYLNGDSGARADRFAIKDAVLCEMPVPYPSVMEQKKIGQFLKNLDNLITLHQRKLTHLQTQKKALLQQMFV